MSSLFLRCFRREPSAGEIVPQIRSEAKLQSSGLRQRNRSSTNRGQSNCLSGALSSTEEGSQGRKENTDMDR